MKTLIPPAPALAMAWANRDETAVIQRVCGWVKVFDLYSRMPRERPRVHALVRSARRYHCRRGADRAGGWFGVRSTVTQHGAVRETAATRTLMPLGISAEAPLVRGFHCCAARLKRFSDLAELRSGRALQLKAQRRSLRAVESSADPKQTAASRGSGDGKQEPGRTGRRRRSADAAAGFIQ